MNEFESLTSALEPWFDKPFEELPNGLQQKVGQKFLPPWDGVSANQRRSLALQWDYEHDPANQRVRQKMWNLQIEINEWEELPAPLPSEKATKNSNLAKLRQELADLDAQENRVMAGYTSRWLPLPVALQQIAEIVGEAKAWPQLRQAVIDGALNARGRLDGVFGNIRREWLSTLLWEEPEGDILWFDVPKNRQMSPRPPSRAVGIEVDGEQISQLWVRANAKTPRPVPPSKARTGPKPGQESLKSIIPDLVEEILRDEPIPKGRGRKAAVIKAISGKLSSQGHVYDDSTIRKALGDAITQRESKNPGK